MFELYFACEKIAIRDISKLNSVYFLCYVQSIFGQKIKVYYILIVKKKKTTYKGNRIIEFL